MLRKILALSLPLTLDAWPVPSTAIETPVTKYGCDEGKVTSVSVVGGGVNSTQIVFGIEDRHAFQYLTYNHPETFAAIATELTGAYFAADQRLNRVVINYHTVTGNTDVADVVSLSSGYSCRSAMVTEGGRH